MGQGLSLLECETRGIMLAGKFLLELLWGVRMVHSEWQNGCPYLTLDVFMFLLSWIYYFESWCVIMTVIKPLIWYQKHGKVDNCLSPTPPLPPTHTTGSCMPYPVCGIVWGRSVLQGTSADAEEGRLSPGGTPNTHSEENTLMRTHTSQN